MDNTKLSVSPSPRSVRLYVKRGEVMGIVEISLVFVGLWLWSTSQGVLSSNGFDYELGDIVPFYANVIGPFHNPSETYEFYSLPYCFSENVTVRKESLGEVLNGHRLVVSPYQIRYLESHDCKLLCKKKLSKDELARFKRAIDEDFYFQMYFDDLPVWGTVGRRYQEEHYFLYKHLHFDIFSNNHRVIAMNVKTKCNSLTNITDDREVEVAFTYSVKWKETDIPYEKRMDIYLISSRMRHYPQVRWFSILNSCVIVPLLTGFLATNLMGVLKKDLIKYTNDLKSDNDKDETGWKNIHGDVFRFPECKSLFSAFIGSGTQLLVLCFVIFILSLLGVLRPYSRGAPLAAVILVYALTSGFAGYTSASFYSQLEGTNWVRNVLLTGSLYSGPLFLTFCFLNSVAVAYGTTAALPFGTIVVLILIWTLVSTPLLVLGGIVGRKRCPEFEAPCRTSKCPREIPLLPLYQRTIPQMAIAGVLPFFAICLELYYLLASLWGHRVYTTYIILFIVFVILLIVTAFVTVALTYFQLAAEDHLWWWRSILCGGATGFYMYGYCIYYYYARTNMSSVMQTTFFFGYMACICYGFFLMLGTVGFYASLFFVRHIYGSIKCE